MDWFRMYGDMPSDPKIGTLSDGEFRTWVELLCAACKMEQSGNTGLTKDTVNWSLRRNVSETLLKLIDTNLVRFNETNEIVIVAWEKRQYESDSSTSRVKKHREKHKNQSLSDETLLKRSCNGLDTEQNRTDTEQINTPPQAASPAIPIRKARAQKQTPLPEGFHVSDRVESWAQEKGHGNLAQHFENFVSAARAKGYEYVDWDEAFMKAVRENWAKVEVKKARGLVL